MAYNIQAEPKCTHSDDDIFDWQTVQAGDWSLSSLPPRQHAAHPPLELVLLPALLFAFLQALLLGLVLELLELRFV